MKRSASTLLLVLVAFTAAACAKADPADTAAAEVCRDLLDQPFTNASAATFREKHPWGREAVTPLIDPPTGNPRAMGMTTSTARFLAWPLCMEDAGFDCRGEGNEAYPLSGRPLSTECRRGNGPAIRNPFPAPRNEPTPIDPPWNG